MNDLRLEIHEHQASFRPGEVVAGIASWQLAETPKSAEVRLIWYTQGKGDRDVGVVKVVTFDNPQATDSQIFEFTLPGEPYSFHGKLIALVWALELLVAPGGLAQRVDITVSPTGQAIESAPSDSSEPEKVV